MTESLFQRRPHRVEIELMEDETFYATAYDGVGEAIAGSGREATPMEALRLLGSDISGELPALGLDAAGRPFHVLLHQAADLLYASGGGPLADSLRLKAEEVAAVSE